MDAHFKKMQDDHERIEGKQNDLGNELAEMDEQLTGLETKATVAQNHKEDSAEAAASMIAETDDPDARVKQMSTQSGSMRASKREDAKSCLTSWGCATGTRQLGRCHVAAR